MVKCSTCGKEIDIEKPIKVTVAGKTHYFHSEEHLNQFQPVKSISRRLASVVLSKASAELIAVIAGIAGIVYTLSDFHSQALLMHTFSILGAIAALVIGVEHLKYLSEHNLTRRAVLLIGMGILIFIVIVVWTFGFSV